MIDHEIFLAEWAVLEDRFQTRHNQETMARYLEALDAELSVPQLKTACVRAFRHETFFPSPQCLIDHALGDFLTRAEEAWDGIMSRLCGGHDVLTEPNTLERQVLVKIGGGKMLVEASDYGRRDMREQFQRRYARALREKDAAQGAVTLKPVAPEAELPRALEGPRGKTVNFLKMASRAGIAVTVPSADQAAD
ncbi:hypothetical protein EHF33_20860 (plasmid) [Deinococcus psychrotolerans]|uniref:Uncharacterized protein n=1 Tax=Deinococcus psychrotolerans TaxID=2489213 RepID=A0A3G8YS70_9DEIO|nr:hypothetical protein [Deinococcus psychrotolerans]AZI45364.1 hypothetical protein EHF33_20860 [Deinococcus psychrotolerans]